MKELQVKKIRLENEIKMDFLGLVPNDLRFEILKFMKETKRYRLVSKRWCTIINTWLKKEATFKIGLSSTNLDHRYFLKTMEPEMIELDLSKDYLKKIDIDLFCNVKNLSFTYAMLIPENKTYVISFLSKLSGLRSLDLSGLRIDNIFNIYPFYFDTVLENLSNLESLEIHSLTNVSKKLTKLTRLHCYEFQTPSCLKTYTSLRDVYFYSDQTMMDMTFSLKKLTRLQLELSDSEKCKTGEING